MSLSDISSRKAILDAIEEFDQIGRAPFLAKYGYGRATKYFLVYNGRLYDSKVIVGVAHGYEHPHKGPLKSHEFVGGERTVKPKLEQLGFKVRVGYDDVLSGFTGQQNPISRWERGNSRMAAGCGICKEPGTDMRTNSISMERGRRWITCSQ